MEMKNNAGKSLKPIRVRYLGKLSAANYGLYLEDNGIKLEDLLVQALGVEKGGSGTVDFLGEIVVVVRPLKDTGLTVEEVHGE